MIRNPAAKRYNRRVILLAALYAALLIPAIYGFTHQLVPHWAAYPIAVLPALPIVGILAAIGRYMVEEQDEYLRMLLVRQTLWASGFALSIATAWGFLEAFDLVGHIDAYYISVLWFGGLGFGACMNKLTVGSAVACA